MGLLSRNKGKRGEREAAAEVARLLRVEARRGVQFKGTDDSPDIQTSLQGVHFEVKRAERLRLYDALTQAILESGGKLPVVLHRKNNEEWVAVVRLDDLPELATKVYLTLAAE